MRQYCLTLARRSCYQAGAAFAHPAVYPMVLYPQGLLVSFSEVWRHVSTSPARDHKREPRVASRVLAIQASVARKKACRRGTSRRSNAPSSSQGPSLPACGQRALAAAAAAAGPGAGVVGGSRDCGAGDRAEAANTTGSGNTGDPPAAGDRWDLAVVNHVALSAVRAWSARMLSMEVALRAALERAANRVTKRTAKGELVLLLRMRPVILPRIHRQWR
jgi:hypothetical protein